MKTKYYHEESLIERILPPIGALIAWADAFFLAILRKALSILDRIVEKEAIMESMFIFSAISGMLFVLLAISQRPELNYSQEDTLKTCLAMGLAVFLLRFLCFHNMKKIQKFPAEAAKETMRTIQRFRPTTVCVLLPLGIYGAATGQDYPTIHWYSNGYFHLAICSLLCIFGIYTHSAIIYLRIQAKVIHENQLRQIKELTGDHD